MQTLDAVNYINDNLILLKTAWGSLAVMLAYLSWERRKDSGRANRRS